MKKVFQTEDGMLHTSARAAAKHEASQGLLVHFKKHCKETADDYLYKAEDVVNYLVQHQDEIGNLVDAFNVAKLAPDYTFEEVQDWVILKLFYGNEFVGIPNSGYTTGIVKRVWDYLQMGEGVPLDTYSDLERDLAKRALEHFKEQA
jgi:hypothetical protein